MTLHREEHSPLRSEPVERLAGRPARHQIESWWHLASGTLACPACDAPVLPGPGRTSPADPISCPYCRHASAVREFLSLAEPTRPTRVAVRVRRPALR